MSAPRYLIINYHTSITCHQNQVPAIYGPINFMSVLFLWHQTSDDNCNEASRGHPAAATVARHLWPCPRSQTGDLDCQCLQTPPIVQWSSIIDSVSIYSMLATERRGHFLWGISILFKVPWCGIWQFQVQVTTMRPGRVGQTRNIKYPKLSRAMTMLPLYNHQHPVQVIKAQNQENHNISPSQPQVRGGAMAMARNHGISITNWPEQRSETLPLSRAW